MACRFEIVLAGEDAGYVNAARQALDEVEVIEDEISAFRDTGALARVNRCAGAAPVIVSRQMLQLLGLCRVIHRDTAGAFDVTTTPLSRCWGFMHHHACTPRDDEISSALEAVGMERVDINLERQSVRFERAGMALNFGAIGKGWALDRVAGGLRARGVHRALLSAGHSSVLAVGSGSGAWPIDLRSPRRTRRLARVELQHGSLATSGAGEQFFEVDGRRYGHVLDPRTGRPAESDLLSVSVLAADAATSDALSTAFLVGGIDLARQYCTTHPHVMAVVTRETGDRATTVIGEFPGARVILNEAIP